MNKLDMESKSIVNDNINKIIELFPTCVSEGKIDFDALKQELSDIAIDGVKEKYQLTWPGKKESIIDSNKRINKTLRPIKEKSLNFEKTKNVYIEGDNLEVLKILQESYLNKIKFIYIDPPYNTGHDFIYNDKFTVERDKELTASGQLDDEGFKMVSNSQTNGRFHSDWLSMIYSRLRLSRNLLREDGLIFISIDDNELANLKKICDEIFGESCFVGCFTRATGTTTGQDANKIGSSLDYCLVYSRSNSFTLSGIELDDNDLKRFSDSDEKGAYSMLQLRKTGNADRKEDRPNMFYSVIAPDGTEVYPFGPSNYLSRWRVGKTTYDELQNDNMIVWKENKTEGNNVTIDGYTKSSWIPYVKYYAEGRTKQVSNLLQNIDGNKKASLEIKELFGNKGVFDNPKPTEFIKLLLQISNVEDSDIVLDFFSGSATTAHSVFKYNLAKDINSKFIMVQLPEKCNEQSEAYKMGYETICDVGEDRIRKASKLLSNQLNSNFDWGFKVYKVDTSNMKDVYYKPSNVSQMNLLDYMSNIKEDRTPEDLLTQVILNLGLTLDLNIEEKTVLNNKVFYVEYNSLVACFDDEIDINIVDEICKCNPMKVVFKDTSFKTDKDKINLEEKIKKLSPDTEVSVL